jgi:hypothetical protein
VATGKGLPEHLIQKVRAAWANQARLEYQQQLEREEAMRNPLPMPYVPGAYSNAIRAAGDRMVADLNKRSEDWFENRRREYREEWQRKQRAY